MSVSLLPPAAVRSCVLALVLGGSLLLAPIAQAQEIPIDVRSRTSAQNAQKSTETSSTESFRLTDDAGTELLRLDPLGRLFIGDQGTPDNASNILNIENNADSLGGIAAIQNADNSADPNTSTFGAIYGESNGDGRPILGFQRSDVGGGSLFVTTSPTNPNAALSASTNGTGFAGLFTGSENGDFPALQANSNNEAPAIRAFASGIGGAMDAIIPDAENGSTVLQLSTEGTGDGLRVNAKGGTGVWAQTDGNGFGGDIGTLGTGRGLNVYRLDQSATGDTSQAFYSFQGGNGQGIVSHHAGNTGPAADFFIDNASNDATALQVSTEGTGTAGDFAINNTSATAAAVRSTTTGAGPAGSFAVVESSSDASVLNVSTQGTGDLANFFASGDTRFRVTNSGDVFADGTFNGGGADVAEAFDVVEDVASYEPGDVLAVSPDHVRTVTRSGEAYSTRVVGVYATKPGVLLSEKGLATNMDTRVPMGIVGVIPTKVTLEGGAITPGDLLVTSSTPGRAMKADPDEVGFGQVLGKALQPYDGDGPGVIEVMVNVK